jgi:transposase
VIETIAREAACPACGTFSSRIKERPLCRIKDVPASGQRVALWWRKRRYACLDPECGRRSFVERTKAIPTRSRLTSRLRAKLADAIARSNQAVDEVAGEYGVAWHTAHRALITAAARWLGEPTPTRVLGIDETQARTVRWLLESTGWKRSDPWLTSFVDADPSHAGPLLGLAPGRSGACVKAWLEEQSDTFRTTVEVVVIDPSAPYASGIRAALPHARIAVDPWHLIRLANDAVTEVRQRVAREQLGRRGTIADPAWVHRRMLLTAGDRLSARQLARL